MKELQNFITESLNENDTLICEARGNNQTAYSMIGSLKPEALAGRKYTPAVGYIVDKGWVLGNIIGEPFEIDNVSGRKEAESLATKDFNMKINFEDLMSSIEKNKKNVYDEVLKKDKYKTMKYAYFVWSKTNEIYCCLYSPMNVYLKGYYAHGLNG